MNVPAILAGVDRLHASAKSGALTVDKVKYLLTFDGRLYCITRADGVPVEVGPYNTRKLSVARAWLREWLAG